MGGTLICLTGDDWWRWPSPWIMNNDNVLTDFWNKRRTPPLDCCSSGALGLPLPVARRDRFWGDIDGWNSISGRRSSPSAAQGRRPRQGRVRKECRSRWWFFPRGTAQSVWLTGVSSSQSSRVSFGRWWKEFKDFFLKIGPFLNYLDASEGVVAEQRCLNAGPWTQQIFLQSLQTATLERCCCWVPILSRLPPMPGTRDDETSLLAECMPMVKISCPIIQIHFLVSIRNKKNLAEKHKVVTKKKKKKPLALGSPRRLHHCQTSFHPLLFIF